MATLDESPSLYLGKPWSVWATKVEGKRKDDSRPSEAVSVSSDNGSNTMKLRKEDMPLYGLCPAMDEFYLVVCECCGQVIKPQALLRHIEQRHPGGGVKRKRRSSRSHSISSTSPVAKMAQYPSSKHDPLDKSPTKGGTRSWDRHKKNNHPMPVVKVERMPSPIAAVKRPVTSSPAKSMTASKSSPKSVTSIKSPAHTDSILGSPTSLSMQFSEPLIAPESPKVMTASKTPDKEPVLSPRPITSPFSLFSKAQTEISHELKSTSNSSQSKSSSSLSKSSSSSQSKFSSSSKSSLKSNYQSKSNSTSVGKSGSQSKSLSQSKLSGSALKSGSSSQVNRDQHQTSRSPSPMNVAETSDSSHNSSPSHMPLSTLVGGKKKLSSSGNSGSSSSSLTSKSSSHAVTVTSSTTTTTSVLTAAAQNTSPSKPKVAYTKPPKLIPCKDREFDPDLHCGVWVADTRRQCTRSLTCKTHALSLRRAVPGRKKPFDELLKEHRATKEALLKAKAEAKAADLEAKGATPPSSHLTNSHSTKPEKDGSSKEHSSGHSSRKSSSITSPPTNKVSKPQIPMPNRPAAPLPPVPKDEPVPEMCSRLSSDGEDEDDDREKLGYPHLAYHPRPAAVNNFGGRLAGSGCYVFGRKNDLLRAAFVVAVDRHLHPPPHKKLCVESKLPQGSQIMTNSKDPYEFTVGDGHGSPWGSVKGHKSKTSKSSSNMSRTIKPKDASGSRSPVSSGAGLGSNLNSPLGSVSQSKSPLGHSQSVSGSTSSSGGSAKRKRSGSSPGPGTGTFTSVEGAVSVNSNPTYNPISIAIPTGSLTLNLNSTTLSNINAAVTVAPNKAVSMASHKNNLLKDLNIVVTNMDTNMVNGQILTPGHLTGANLADVTQLQLNSLVEKSSSAKAKSGKSTNAKSSGLKHVLVSSAQDRANMISPMVTTLASGTVVMDTHGGAMLTPVSLATSLNLGSITVSPPQSSPSTTPSPLFSSGSTSPQVSATSPLPNGVLPSPSGIGLKAVPVNHLSGATMAVSPLSRNSTPSPAAADATQAANAHITKMSSSKSKGSRSSGHHKTSSGKSHQLNPLMNIATSQQFPAGAITLTTQPNRLLMPTVFPNQMLGSAAPGSQFSHIQIQPKQGGGKTVTTGKLPAMSLTIPIVATSGINVASTQRQAQALILQSDERQKHLTQQMQNSPSNVIS